MGHCEPNFGGMVLGWPPSKIVSGDPDFQAMAAKLKIEKKGDEILTAATWQRVVQHYIPGFSV